MTLRFHRLAGRLLTSAALIGSAGFALAETVLPPVVGSVGETITLDATDGLDVLPSEDLALRWSWVSRPAASVAEFSETEAVRPTVALDVPGRFEARVEFYDPALPASDGVIGSAVVELGTANLAPVARAAARGAPGGGPELVLDGAGALLLAGGLIQAGTLGPEVTEQYAVLAPKLGLRPQDLEDRVLLIIPEMKDARCTAVKIESGVYGTLFRNFGEPPIETHNIETHKRPRSGC